MRKAAIRIVGALFLLWGLWYIVDFLWTGNQPRTLIGYMIFGYNIAGLVFVVILLCTGFSIIRLQNSGRIWGLIVLWVYFLPNLAFSILSFVFAANPDTDFPLDPGWLRFEGAKYGLDQDHTITNPWYLLAFSVLVTIFIAMQIYILSSKKNRVYFTAQYATGS